MLGVPWKSGASALRSPRVSRHNVSAEEVQRHRSPMSHSFILPLILGFLAMSNAGSPPSAGVLLVANKGEHTLGIIDSEAGKQLATVPEDGVTGHEVIASPDGR